MMIRDVADEGLAAKFELDDQFDQKWTGQLQEWGNWQGLPDLYARYAWRAHWTIPSPSFLLDYFQRFRNTEEFGTPEEILEEIKTALNQQDISPYWVPKYIASAYKPLLRIDGRLAFNAGIIDDEAMKLSFNAQGYDDDLTDQLLELAKYRRLQLLRRDPFVKAAASGEVSADRAYDVVGAAGLDRDVFDQAVSDEKLLAVGAIKKQMINQVISGYVKGAFSADDVQSWFESQQIPGDLADAEITRGNLEKQANIKLIPINDLFRDLRAGFLTESDVVTQLQKRNYSQDAIQSMFLNQYTLPKRADILKFAGSGLLSPAEAVNQLVQSGYNPTYAQMIMEQFVYSQEQKQLKEEAAAQAKAERQAQELAKQAAAAEAKAQAAAAKALATQEKEAKAAAQLAARQAAQAARAAQQATLGARQKAARETTYVRDLEAISAELSKKTGEEPDQAIGEVEALYQSMMTGGLFTAPEIVAILKLAASTWTAKISEDFDTWITKLVTNSEGFIPLMLELEQAYENPPK